MPSARQLITRGLRRIGVIAAGETPDDNDMEDSLDSLNELVGSWNVQRLLIPALQRVTMTTQAGVASYTVGAGGALNVATLPVRIEDGAFVRFQGVDMPLSNWSQGQYAAIDLKTTGRVPDGFYYEPSVPLGALLFWPVPDAAYTVTLPVWGQLQSFPDYDTDVKLGVGVEPALSWSFAEYVMGDYERNLPAVAAMARRLRQPLIATRIDNTRAPAAGDVGTGRLAAFLAGE